MITKKSLTWFGTLAVLVMIIALFAISDTEPSNAVRILAFPRDVDPSPTPQPSTMQPVTPEATSKDTVTEEAIPLCAFDAPLTHTPTHTAQTATPLDSYTFSDPQVVLTGTTAIRLFQWLPDGQRLLIGRGIAGKPEELLEVSDLQTGESKPYAQTQIVGNKVTWLEAEQAVAFVESLPENGNSLKLSYGIGEPIRELATDFRSPLSVGHNGEHLIFSANDRGGQLQILQVSNGTTTPLLTQLSGYYHTVLSADEMRMAVYNHQHFYLVDISSEQICEIDLGQVGTGEYSKVRASDVAWSADGRYLAMLTKYGSPVRFFSLRIVDLQAKVPYDIVFDERFVFNIDWSPTSNVLLVTVDANPDPSMGSFDSLYLVDVASYNSRHILPEYQFFAAGDFGVLWSPDGKTIGIACADFILPDEVREWRMCTIGVEIQQ